MATITVQQFISEAVREGVSLAPLVYLELLEESLTSDVLLTEAGSAQNYLAALISEAEQGTVA